MLHRLREEIPLLKLPDSAGELETSPGEWYSTGDGVKDCTEPCAGGTAEAQRRGDELLCPPPNPEAQALLSPAPGEGTAGPALETSGLLPGSKAV